MSNFEEHIEPFSAEEMTERADYLGELEEDRQIIDAAQAEDEKKQKVQAFEIQKARAAGYQQAREDLETIMENGGPVFLITDADFSVVDEITIKPQKGDEITYEKARRGFWELMDREDYPLPHPMLVCSECQKTNHYPGKYCTYCGSDNKHEEG